jgi:integrase
MSLFKRPNSSYWWYEFIFQGVRYQRSTRLTNKTAAARVEAVHRAQLAQSRAGIVERQPAPLLKHFAPQFLESVKLERKPNTHRCYSISVKKLALWFGAKRLDEITADEIRQFKEARLRDGRSGATVNRDLECLRRVLSIAMKTDVITTSPFVARKVEFLPEIRRERVLTFAEENKYLDAASPLLRDVATIILELGLRPEEVFKMRVEDVHLLASTPYVHVPGGKTVNARRDVAITKKAMPVLHWRLATAKGDYLFPFRIGGGYDWERPMKQLQPAHREALLRSGIRTPFRLYDLRHTFGTRAAEAGTDPLTLARLMGHADLKTTQRYVHLSKRHLVEAQEKIERFRAEREIAEAEQQQQKRGQKHPATRNNRNAVWTDPLK